jgi:predicted MFS family arabinose efflux permease
LTPVGEFKKHWRSLAGCTIAASVGTIGLNAYTSGAFVPELVAKVGYSREQMSVATLLLSGTVAIVAPFVGQAVDHWGAFRVIAFAVIGEMLGFFLLGTAPADFAWYASAMVLLGLLGAGTTPPSFSRIVTAHFDRRRGLALGLMISGLGVTSITAPMLLTQVIARLGWRGGYLSLSALVSIFGAVGLLLIRSDFAAARERLKPAVPQSGNWSAFKHPLYWYILFCFAAPALFGAGYLLHLISILRARGFSPTQAAQIQALVGFSIIAGRLMSGLAMDRLFAPYVAAGAFMMTALGTTLLLSSQAPLLCLAALGIGLTIGAELDILAFILSRYFGLASFGRLYGLAYSVMILAGGCSPVLIAKLARAGDYTTGIIVSAVGIFVAAILVVLLPQFRTPRSLAGMASRDSMPPLAS